MQFICNYMPSGKFFFFLFEINLGTRNTIPLNLNREVREKIHKNKYSIFKFWNVDCFVLCPGICFLNFCANSMVLVDFLCCCWMIYLIPFLRVELSLIYNVYECILVVKIKMCFRKIRSYHPMPNYSLKSSFLYGQ